jgi:hypothetical protein
MLWMKVKGEVNVIAWSGLASTESLMTSALATAETLQAAIKVKLNSAFLMMFIFLFPGSCCCNYSNVYAMKLISWKTMTYVGRQERSILCVNISDRYLYTMSENERL